MYNVLRTHDQNQNGNTNNSDCELELIVGFVWSMHFFNL